jgi:dethiobiotin synthetase/malonyl-CoA O-methyltransferase
MKIFVTGTDTNIGKTFVSMLLCKHLNATYFKPIQTGEEKDADFLAVHCPHIKIIPSVYDFPEPVSPHLAAKMAQAHIDINHIALPSHSPLIVEGAGGVLVPLNQEASMIDLIARWKIPTLVVAKSGLGTINHTCLTLEALRRRHIPIMGVVMNKGINTHNKQAIEYYGGVPVIAEIPDFTDTNTRDYEYPFSNLATFYANATG